MSTYVHVAKPYNINIDVRVSFLSRLSLDETIVTWSINATTFSGSDNRPLAILRGDTVADKDEIVQRLTGGLPGDTYKLWIAVRSTLSNIYVQEIKVSVITKDFPFRVTTSGDSRVTTSGDSRIAGVF